MKNFILIFLFMLIFLTTSNLFSNYVWRGRAKPMSFKEVYDDKVSYIVYSLVVASIISYNMNKQKTETEKKDKQDTQNRLSEREKYHSLPNTHECRVCGCYSEDYPWGEDGRSPSFEICSCCGVQFGKEDNDFESIKQYRAKWISAGGVWFDKGYKPTQWDITEQMKKIPAEFV
jgi:hypothetical protein